MNFMSLKTFRYIDRYKSVDIEKIKIGKIYKI